MIAFLNQNDIDNLHLAIDKMKSVDFDAARKMELLLEGYEHQDAGDDELTDLKNAIEDLPGWHSKADHLGHVSSTAELLERATDTVSAWDGATDDEPLDEAVKRLVQAAEAPEPAAGRMETALMDILDATGRDASDSFSRIRELAQAALP